jgi:hypothetical protein
MNCKGGVSIKMGLAIQEEGCDFHGKGKQSFFILDLSPPANQK